MRVLRLLWNRRNLPFALIQRTLKANPATLRRLAIKLGFTQRSRVATTGNDSTALRDAVRAANFGGAERFLRSLLK